MTRFNSKVAAAVLLVLAGLYATASLALGRSAHSDIPPDLSLKAADAGVTVPKTVAALLATPAAVLADVRPDEEFAAYRIPGSIHVPGASASDLVHLAKGHPVIVIASKDGEAQKLVGAARQLDPSGAYHFLQNGVRDFYLAFELPVELFNDAKPPGGYAAAVGTVKSFLATRDPRTSQQTRMALLDLAKYNYEPTLLKQAGKAQAAGGPRKKISGGCGG